MHVAICSESLVVEEKETCPIGFNWIGGRERSDLWNEASDLLSTHAQVTRKLSKFDTYCGTTSETADQSRNCKSLREFVVMNHGNARSVRECGFSEEFKPGFLPTFWSVRD